MRVLFAKVFGIGNAVMAVPAVKMLLREGVDVTVAVGDTPDDLGARNVFSHLSRMLDLKPPRLEVVSLPVTAHAGHFDVAILSIPYDGRWRAGLNFTADVVLDGRPRPDPSAPLGLECWKRHEVDYQVDVVRELLPGLSHHQTPPTSFTEHGPFRRLPKLTYLGVGYKRDPEGYWLRKHWGTERYAELVCRILASDPDVMVLSSGSPADVSQTLAPIARRVSSEFSDSSRFDFSMCDVEHMFELVSRCSTYVGNDTGTMHVAASMGLSVVGLFFMPGAEIKNPPYCSNRRVVTAPSPELLSVDRVFDEWRSACSATI